MMEGLFPGGAALVFGATSGLGEAAARALAQAGADLGLCFRSKRERAETLADEITGLGRSASVHAVDVTDPASIEAAQDAAIAAHGRVHTVIWAAGPLVDQFYLSQTPMEAWRRAIDVEVHGFFAAMQAALPHMREARLPVAVNVEHRIQNIGYQGHSQIAHGLLLDAGAANPLDAILLPSTSLPDHWTLDPSSFSRKNPTPTMASTISGKDRISTIRRVQL